MPRWRGIYWLALALGGGIAAAAWGDAASMPATATSTDIAPVTSDASADWSLPAIKQKMLGALPPVIGDGFDMTAWGWLGGTHTSSSQYSNYFDAEVGLGISKSFDQNVTIAAQGNFIDANGVARGEWEQGYVSAVVNRDNGAFITIGKFNANFGVEARDFWNRTTGTTSLLFGAQPQDLTGCMITVPVGETGVTLRPFLSENFEGGYDFNQPPSGGLVVEYQPVHGVRIAVTNWVGPGFVTYGGEPLEAPYPKGEYGQGGAVTGNWQGPNLMAERGGTLYFGELKAAWQIRPELQVSAEALLGTSGTKYGRFGWTGIMGQVDYDLSDKWRLFGRISYLDDSDWLITGQFQCLYEYSLGTAYQLTDGVEIRGEYRHDSSNAIGDLNSISLHLALTF